MTKQRIIQTVIALLIIGVIASLFMYYFGQKDTTEQNKETQIQNIDTAAPQEADLVADQTGEITPTPIIKKRVDPAKLSREEKTIQDWSTYNYTNTLREDFDTIFSFQIPYVGDYCQGCFDGTGGLDQSVQSSTSISGGYDSPTSDRKWFLIINSQKMNAAVEYDVLSDEMYNSKVAKNVGEKIDAFVLGTINNHSTIIEKTSQDIEGTPVTQIKTTQDQIVYNHALFQKDGYNNEIIFVTDQEMFKNDTFDTIIDTLSFSLYEDPDYGEPWYFVYRRQLGYDTDYHSFDMDLRKKMIEKGKEL